MSHWGLGNLVSLPRQPIATCLWVRRSTSLGLPCHWCRIRVPSLGATGDGSGFGDRVAHKTCDEVCQNMCIFPREAFGIFTGFSKGGSEEAERRGLKELRHQNSG